MTIGLVEYGIMQISVFIHSSMASSVTFSSFSSSSTCLHSQLLQVVQRVVWWSSEDWYQGKLQRSVPVAHGKKQFETLLNKHVCRHLFKCLYIPFQGKCNDNAEQKKFNYRQSILINKGNCMGLTGSCQLLLSTFKLILQNIFFRISFMFSSKKHCIYPRDQNKLQFPYHLDRFFFNIFAQETNISLYVLLGNCIFRLFFLTKFFLCAQLGNSLNKHECFLNMHGVIWLIKQNRSVVSYIASHIHQEKIARSSTYSVLGNMQTKHVRLEWSIICILKLLIAQHSKQIGGPYILLLLGQSHFKNQSWASCQFGQINTFVLFSIVHPGHV